MSSAICFNLDQSKILLSGNELIFVDTPLSEDDFVYLYLSTFNLYICVNYLGICKDALLGCRFFIPPQTKFVGGISLSDGRSVCKILSGQLVQFQSSALDTLQKCSLGAVDVQDTHFVKIPSRIIELLPLI